MPNSNQTIGSPVETLLGTSRSRSSWNDRFEHWERPASETEDAQIQRSAGLAQRALRNNAWLAREGVQVRPQGTVKDEAQNAGVKLAGLSPRIDIQRQSMGAGAVSLHEDNVPLRNKGSGSKKLIGAAMQMKLHGGKNISLIDEIEMGLELHRIRGLIYKLKKSRQQIFATTHSPVVIRELGVADNELYVCKRDAAGTVTLESLGTVPDIQGQVRANAEAFLGSRIIACEGPTEIGCLRAYDIYRFDENDPPIWSLATSYFNCGGASRIKPVCPQLIALGYARRRRRPTVQIPRIP